MIAIGLRFPAGRFHATPWGRHVNEGMPEWPPSPWRLLRALVASWKTKAPHLEEAQVRAVLEQLASPPSFHLPAATTGHSRHYMRWYKKGPEDQTLVFDAFVCLDRDSEVVTTWPDATLDKDAGETLETLLQNIGYLGRTESWCEARLLGSVVGEPNARPLNGQSPGREHELVRVLCAHPDQAFENEHVKSGGDQRGRGKSKRPVYEPAWHLCIETAQLHEEKWSDPPGSKWVTYLRPSNCFDPPPKPRSRLPRPRPQPQVVRLALDSSVLPLVTEALPIAEAMRRALIWQGVEIIGRRKYGSEWSRQQHRDGRQPVDLTLIERFAGKDQDKRPLEGHGHAYYLPTDEDGDGRIDHLTLVARDGFGPEEMRAIDRLNVIQPRGRDNASHPLRVLLLAYGRFEEFQPAPLPIKRSRIWESATPYIAARYAKTRGRSRIDLRSIDDRRRFLHDDLRRQLKEVLNINVSEIEEITPLLNASVFRIAGRWRPIEFKRRRSKPDDDSGRRISGAFCIRFRTSIPGPVCLGHSCHFGLGLFVPASSEIATVKCNE